MSEPQEPRRITPRARAETLARIRAWHEAVAQNVVGVQMPDGTIFAGTLRNGKKLYVMPRNESIAMDFNMAAAHVQRVNNNKRLSHDDWRLPTREELALLWQNRNKGALKGAFECSTRMRELTDGDYWSSTPASATLSVVYVQNLGNGATGCNNKAGMGVVRLVR